MTQPEEKASPLINISRHTFHFLRYMSLGNLVQRGSTVRLEYYVISWAVLELAAFVSLAFISLPFEEPLFFALFGYRLFEIFIATFNSLIIAVIEGKKHRSVPRLLLLAMLNYVEIILVFSVFFFFLLPEATLLKSLNYSISLATLSGLTFDNPTETLYLVGSVEIFLGTFFIGGILSSLVNYFGSKE